VKTFAAAMAFAQLVRCRNAVAEMGSKGGNCCCEVDLSHGR
jgi:hypothetical protein